MFAVIYIPNFFLQAALRHEPELFSQPVALLHDELKSVCQFTLAAQQAGVCEGLTPTQALARCSNLLVRTRSIAQEHSTTEILLECAYAFSPSIEATAPGICTLDLKGLPEAVVADAPLQAKPFENSTEVSVLKGHREDSPAFQRWGDGNRFSSPEGTAEIGSANSISHSVVPSGLELRLEANPALKRWANIDCPSGPSPSGAALNSRTTLPLQEWGEKIIAQLASFNLRAQVGIAENSDLARHAAKIAQPVYFVENSTKFISALPVESVEPPPEILSLLSRWGIRTLGEFTALQKNNLAERLGAEAIELFDRATANEVRPLNLVKPKEIFEETMEFESEIETLQPLLFILRRFIEQLSRRLELFYFVAEEIQLRLTLSSGDHLERTFRVPSPTRNIETLFRMLQTHLESVQTDSPIVALHLAAKPAKPEHFQFGLFETALRDPNQFYETLAQLTSLIGSDGVGTPVREDTFRPDAFRMEPVQFESKREFELQNSKPETSPGLALRRFRPPVPAVVELHANQPVLLRSEKFVGPIARAAGPFRSSGNWWEPNQLWSRDEWDIETAHGDLFRLFAQNGQWFVEGAYD